METQKKSWGGVIAIVIIILVIIVAAVMLSRSKQTEAPAVPSGENQAANGGTGDDLSDIEAEINNLDLDGLDDVTTE